MTEIDWTSNFWALLRLPCHKKAPTHSHTTPAHLYYCPCPLTSKYLLAVYLALFPWYRLTQGSMRQAVWDILPAQQPNINLEHSFKLGLHFFFTDGWAGVYSISPPPSTHTNNPKLLSWTTKWRTDKQIKIAYQSVAFPQLLRELKKKRRTFWFADKTDLKKYLKNLLKKRILKIFKLSFIQDQSQICIFNGLGATAL